MLDVHRLRLLRELSLHGTIAATARRCSLTPSAVSQQLSVLEQEVGTALFIRNGRRLKLTQAARVLVEHTEDILAAIERARAEVAGLGTAVRGTIRLAAFPSAARTLVPGAIERCRMAHPDLFPQLTERQDADAVTDLKAGRADLALIQEYNLLPGVCDDGIERDVLLREPLLAALPPQLPVPEGPLSLDALAGRPWIAGAGDSMLRSTFERACALAGFVPRLDFASSDYTVMFTLVRAELGVALVPRLAVEPSLSGIQLRKVAVPELFRTVSVAVRAGSRRHPPIAALLTALHASARALPTDGFG